MRRLTLRTAGLLVVALMVAGCAGDSAATTQPATSAPSTDSTAAPQETTTSSSSTTTTTVPPTTTTTIPEDRADFVGWWTGISDGGGILDIRISADGTFMHWDSASGVCRANGFDQSPMTWAGSAEFHEEEVPRMTASGLITCFPYEGDVGEIGDTDGDFQFDEESGTLVAADGTSYAPVEYVAPPASDNPFAGTWEATDSDGTRVVTVIAADGTLSSEDTRSGGCENMGLTGATWSAEGVGAFDLTAAAFEVPVQTICHPPGAEPVPRSEGVFTFGYVEETDELVLQLFLDTVFTRVP